MFTPFIREQIIFSNAQVQLVECGERIATTSERRKNKWNILIG